MQIISIEEKAYELMKRQFDIFSKEIEDKCETRIAKEKWLDNQDVCMLLQISKRTLQSFRDNRILAFSKIGNKCYYKVSDINKLIANSEIKAK